MKNNLKFAFYGNQAIVMSHGEICSSENELSTSSLFVKTVEYFLDSLRKKESPLLEVFQGNTDVKMQNMHMAELLAMLSEHTKEDVLKKKPEFAYMLRDTNILHRFVESLYNYWRGYERFFLLHSEGKDFYMKPYRAFRETIGTLNGLARRVYRRICTNITGTVPTVYRHIPAAFQVGVIVNEEKLKLPPDCKELFGVPIIKQVQIIPPLIIDPPMNTRKGEFRKVDENPLNGVSLNKGEWLCYPAKVGELTILFYFHKMFISLGTAVANLFDLAEEKDLGKMPDAVFLYGLDEKHMKRFGELPTVFFEDNDMMIGAVPGSDEYGYFGYIKKMMLTLHNIIMMKRGRMPVHGAMVKISLKNGKSANVVIMGDSGVGKSESMEAFRVLAKDYLRDMVVIFDDMGSLEIKDDKVIAYGTETGAFVRLDDLHPGFAFGNIDRSIIMSPQKINARAVLPITFLSDVLKGHEVDYFLYANNYEEIDKAHPYFKRFESLEDAFEVFKKGARMAKGTTSEKGLVQTYFANIFGPVQYRSLHEKIATNFFEKMFESGIIVGELRTRLGIPGYETKGPEEAARALISLILKD
ncbi:phosphoenolpyruvate carboxykinase [Candidatus Woesearchaeota archaeon]|nr:phosphoenolpyruvate carboxykinase [Candidatus Woesearchaeota archaeon]